MATNKQAQIRYIALDKCFRNTGRKYFYEDLIAACSEAIYNATGIQTGVSRRQIFSDLDDMNTLYGAETGFEDIIDRIKEGRRVYYRYKDPNFSISSQPMTANEQMQLKESLQTLSRFKGFPQFEWIEDVTTRLSAALNLDNNTKPVIEFEQNAYLKGLNYFTQLYEAITYGKSLVINYKSFKAESATPIEFHPYYLKQFNLRWFLIGRNHEYGSIQNLSLDRIEDIDALSNKDELLIANIGEERELLQRIFLNNVDYKFERKLRIGSDFKSWEDLEQFHSPLTDLIIVDNFILGDKSLFETNLKGLVKNSIKSSIRKKINSFFKYS